MSDNWAVEAHDKTGRTFVFRPNVAGQQVAAMVVELLANEHTGGVVFYRSIDASSNKGGGENGDAGLGLVANEEPPCKYCTLRGGHDADCSVNS